MQPFSLHQVRLLPGPFQQAQQAHGWRLLAQQPDRLLHGLRTLAGRPVRALPPAPRGEPAWALGPYLSACSAMRAATDGPAFRQRVQLLVGAIDPCLRALADAGAWPRAAPLLRGLAAGLHDAQRHADVPAAQALRELLPAADEAPAPATPPPGDDPARYGQLVYRHDELSLQVERLIPSVLHWPAMGLRVRQLPQAGARSGARLLVQAAERRRLCVRLRVPAGASAALSVNGRSCGLAALREGCVEVERHWRRGDEIAIELPAPHHAASR